MRFTLTRKLLQHNVFWKLLFLLLWEANVLSPFVLCVYLRLHEYRFDTAHFLLLVELIDFLMYSFMILHFKKPLLLLVLNKFTLCNSVHKLSLSVLFIILGIKELSVQNLHEYFIDKMAINVGGEAVNLKLVLTNSTLIGLDWITLNKITFVSTT